MAALRLDDLTKIFGKPSRGCTVLTALEHLNLDVPDGQLLALLGPSGSGKTTTLRLIAGLEKATSGNILLDGRSIDREPPQTREVSMAFQSPALLPQLNVGQNIGLGAKLRKINDATARVQAIAKMLDIFELLGRMPESLSGGQQQRVALARALVLKPQVLLLDEPLASLDPLARIELRQVIRRVQKELRTTTLYVTHDQSEAVGVADRIALLREGKLQQTGIASELYENPANLFVAQFIGPSGINTLSGEVLPDEQGGVLFRPAGSTKGFRFPTHLRAGPVICGIRPSAVQIDPSGPMAGMVTEVIATGWSNTASLAVENQSLKTGLSPETRIQAGDTVRCRIDPNQVFFFEPSTGYRIDAGEAPNPAVI